MICTSEIWWAYGIVGTIYSAADVLRIHLRVTPFRGPVRKIFCVRYVSRLDPADVVSRVSGISQRYATPVNSLSKIDLLHPNTIAHDPA